MRGVAKYKNVGVQTSTQEELVVILLEAAQRRQLQAVEAIEIGDAHVIRVHLQRAREIYAELASSLDHDVAPKLSGNLHSLYTWCITEIAAAGRSSDAKRLQGPIRVTKTLLEAWESVVSTVE